MIDKNKYIDISFTTENHPILFPKKHKTKLKNFNYKDNYIKSFLIDNNSLNDYLLTCIVNI